MQNESVNVVQAHMLERMDEGVTAKASMPYPNLLCSGGGEDKAYLNHAKGQHSNETMHYFDLTGSKGQHGMHDHTMEPVAQSTRIISPQ